MKLTVDPQLFKLFPVVRLGVLHGVLKSAPDLEKLDALRTSSLAKLQGSFSDVKSLEGDDRIKKWMDVYKKMGLNPRKKKPTHWALASRLVKDGKWPEPIGPIIDVYLVNQVNSLLPHGGYDLTTLSGDLQLSLSPGGEPFQPIGSSDACAEETKDGEVVYRDDARVLTRAWNYRDCEPTKISNDSVEFAIFIEDTPGDEHGESRISAAVENLKCLYEIVFGKFKDGEGGFLSHTAVWTFRDGKNVAESTWQGMTG